MPYCRKVYLSNGLINGIAETLKHIHTAVRFVKLCHRLITKHSIECKYLVDRVIRGATSRAKTWDSTVALIPRNQSTNKPVEQKKLFQPIKLTILTFGTVLDRHSMKT